MFRGDRLKELRKEKGIKQDTLGELLNVSGSIITRYEKNQLEPRCDSIKTLANYLDVSIDYLLDNSNQKKALNNIDTIESELINKYRELDERDHIEILELINVKYERVLKIKNASNSRNGEETASSETA